MMKKLRFPAGPAVAALCAAGLVIPLFSFDGPLPPGNRPLPASVHALIGGRVVLSPGKELDQATIILSDGRIAAVGKDAAIPADARVHDMSGTTIYAGFIDAHVSLGKKGAERAGPIEEDPPVDSRRLTSGAGMGFPGAPSLANASDANSLVTPQLRIARTYNPDPEQLKALRAEGFAAANVVPDRGVIRGTSTFVSLGSTDPDEAIIRPDTFQHIALTVPAEAPDAERRDGPDA